MALTKVTDDVVVDQLLTVFRLVGYDGATMAQLADATGLQKASLYHRFPDGKLAMAKAVLNHIEALSEAGIGVVLRQSTLKPVNRLKTVLATINALYDGGQLSCVLRALSLGTAAPVLRAQIAGIFGGWISGFTQLGMDVGMTQTDAARLAQSVVVRVQGVLILAQTLNQPDLFGHVLTEIETDFSPQQ